MTLAWGKTASIRALRQPGRITGVLAALVVAAVVFVAVFAPLVAPYDPLKVDIGARLLAPSMQHLMGTDQLGRDILSRVIWGARPSLIVGTLAVLIALAGGVPLGLAAGYYRGLFEEGAMRIVEILAAIPLLIWAIAVVGITGVGAVHIGPLTFPNEAKVVILVGILNIPGIARITHSVALIESRADYVRARRAQGASTASIVLGDVLPNCLSPIIVYATLLIAVAIVIEASLSFVGLGVQPPAPSWGGMLAEARNFVLTGEWWCPVFPGICISVTVISLNLLGDALRDAFDPRNRGMSAEGAYQTGLA